MLVAQLADWPPWLAILFFFVCPGIIVGLVTLLVVAIYRDWKRQKRQKEFRGSGFPVIPLKSEKED
jgi:hypothetical protein